MNISRRAGFTIIELMTVVTILGVFAALAAPSMADLLASTAIKGAQSDFYSALIAARSEAIKRRANATVAPIGADWTTGWTVKVNGNTFQTIDALKPRVVVNPTTPVPVVFGMNGRVSSGSQTIKFSDSIRDTVANRCVVVGSSGLPRMRTGC